MVNLKSFTNALTVFCILILVQFLIPDSFPKLGALLKYITVISTIIILMMYNKILGEIPISDLNNEVGPDTINHTPIINLERATPKELYENLIKLVIETTRSINENSRSAIYIIDPIKNNYTMQNGNSSEFVDSISLTNELVNQHISKKKYRQ